MDSVESMAVKNAGGKNQVNDDENINKSSEPLMQRDFTLATAIKMKGRNGSDSFVH